MLLLFDMEVHGLFQRLDHMARPHCCAHAQAEKSEMAEVHYTQVAALNAQVGRSCSGQCQRACDH
jgi:hypothetical protein